MSASHIQVVKWSFPAFALIIGLLWYKRRRVDRADPGGTTNPDCSDRSLVDHKKETASSKPVSSFYDSGIQIDESYSLSASSQPAEEIVCSPRKRSECLDIPQRKGGSQLVCSHTRTPRDEEAWYNYPDASPSKMEVQLGSNPKISNFDMVARSRSASSLENATDSGKVLKIFENVEEEEEQKPACKSDSLEHVNGTEENEPSVDAALKDGAKAHNQAQALSERDSANHSPVSGVLEGSVTDEARSEGSTDSGKGKSNY